MTFAINLRAKIPVLILLSIGGNNNFTNKFGKIK